MKILVTGGAGYLGSVLVEHLLREGHSVMVLDILMFGGEGLIMHSYNPRFKLVRGDVRDAKVVDTALDGVDAVCHAAALVGEFACNVDANLTEQINHKAAVDIALAAKKRGAARFVFTSTCSNYGVSAPGQLATETSKLRPLSSYATTKIATEKDILALSDSSFAVTVLRLSTIFGLSAKMRFNLLINEFVRDSFFKKKIVLYKEKAWRPYTHIADASSAISCVLASKVALVSGEIFNIGSENYQKKQLVPLVKKYVPDVVVENKGGIQDNRDYKVSFEKAKKILGYRAERSVKDGVDELFAAISNGMFYDPYDERYEKWIDEDLLKKYETNKSD